MRSGQLKHLGIMHEQIIFLRVFYVVFEFLFMQYVEVLELIP